MTGRRNRRALGIVRVSKTGTREGESFISPGQQRERIAEACQRDGLDLLETIDEIDVSGGTPLAKRAGLRRAIEAVEAGDAEVIIAAYFDRLIRSVVVQAELVDRVEAAGGQVMAVDVGAVSNASAGQWLSGALLGAVSEYTRRTAAERSGEAQKRAVERGAVPWGAVTPGYKRGPNKAFLPDPDVAPIVAEAFRRRAEGQTVEEVRAYLGENGIVRSFHGVQSLLHSRVVLGEIHFGKLVNLNAHEPIVDADVWQRVQAMMVPAGRRAQSQRLLSRLGVLRCAECGSRMILGMQTQNGRRYPFYKCGTAVKSDCPRRYTIGAAIVEGIVEDAVRAIVSDAKGIGAAEQNIAAAEAAVERAQADLDAAIRAFSALAGERAAAERLAELQTARDDARAHLDQLGGQGAGLALFPGGFEWDALSFEGRRAIVRATIERVTVGAGKGAGRVTVVPLGQ